MIFSLGSKSYRLSSCVCLFQSPPTSVVEYLVLTRDMKLVHIAQLIPPEMVATGKKSRLPLQPTLLSPAQAADFLESHGEGDIVEEFADLFTESSLAVAAA
ncbi:MAG: hypothetical protein ACOYK8_09735 [Alphaproteobacteria bacterium]